MSDEEFWAKRKEASREAAIAYSNEVRQEFEEYLLEHLAKTKKLLNEAPVPKEGLFWNPETNKVERYKR